MTEQIPKPGAVHFRPCNSAQIRSRAEKDVRTELKASTPRTVLVRSSFKRLTKYTFAAAVLETCQKSL